jgi:hypothetical protein
MRAHVGRYRLGPLLIGSDIVIPELRERSDAREPDVWIRLGKVPDRIAGVVANETRWWASRDEYLQRVPEVANFLVRNGREIVIEPAGDAAERDIRAYLLGPVVSCLFLQAGMYALHASAVRMLGGAVAFLGDSGAGKSTLAAFLERRGFPVISDDLCVFDPAQSDDGAPRVLPVAPALKLWPSALDRLGRSPESLPQAWSGELKYRMPVRELEEDVPLSAVVFLEWDEDPDAAPKLVQLNGVDALARLMRYFHFEYLMKAVGRQTECFQLSGRILRRVAAYTLRRPKNFVRIESVLDALIDGLSHADGQLRSE